MNCTTQGYRIAKIDISTSFFLSQSAPCPQQRQYEQAYLKRSSKKRLSQTYKKCLFKMQERKSSPHAIANDQFSFDNQQQLHVKRKESLNSNLEIIKRRSLQMNPGIFMVKQKNKTKIQTIKIDSISQKNILKESQPIATNYLTKSLSQRSEKKQKYSVYPTTPSNVKVIADIFIKHVSHSKQRQETSNTLNQQIENNLQNSAINPYTNELYLHSRNQKIDEMRKMKNRRKIHHKNSIVESYKVITMKLSNPLEKYSRKLTYDDCLVPENDIDCNQEKIFKNNFKQDVTQVDVCKGNRHRRTITGNYNSRLKSNRPLTSKVYHDYKDAWAEDQPAPWPAEINANQSLDIIDKYQ